MDDVRNILGVDIGGVILDFIPYKGTDMDVNSGDDFLKIPPIKDAIDSLATLNSLKFTNNIFLVSRYGPDGPERVLEWLRRQDFFARTGIPESHYYGCAERHEKLPIVKKLNISHFVDDRAEILNYMIGHVPNLYLFQSLDENEEDIKNIVPKVHFVHEWEKLLEILLK